MPIIEEENKDEFTDWEGKKVDGRKRRTRWTENDKKRIRALAPYRKLPDEDFDVIWAEMQMKARPSIALEKRIEKKLKEFSEDYDVSDLKINDKLVLRALVQALLQLEDLEQYANSLREQGIEQSIIVSLREINMMMQGLRKDISSMQEDLKITRKHRKGDKEQSVIAYIDDLKLRAKEFYQSAMTYVFCPKCNQLLFTFWIQDPYEKKNRIKLFCTNKLANGEECGEEILVSPKELVENKTGYSSNVPESLN